MGRNFRELFLATIAAQLLAFTTGSYAAYFPPTVPELRGHGPALSPAAMGQGADLLETRVWDALSDRVASYSASRSFRTAAI